MIKPVRKKYLRYSPNGLGYSAWLPGNKGLPDFWLGTVEIVQELAAELGLWPKRI